MDIQGWSESTIERDDLLSCLWLIKHAPEKHVLSGLYLGFTYVVMHNGFGYRLGYICIPEGHRWYGCDYESINVRVHGGLTYGDFCADESHHRKHFWLGFDCAHFMDLPDLTLPFDSEEEKFAIRRLRNFSVLSSGTGTVKDTRYVIKECRNLCKAAHSEGERNEW